MSNNRPIQLGLCCLNTVLRAQTPTVFSSRKMIIRTIKEHGIDVLKKKITQNLKDTLVMIDWNEQNGIKVFRMSSEMFPHYTNPEVESYSLEFAKELLVSIGEKARSLNHRLTFHPGQYNVVGTPDIDKFNKTCKELKYHADILEMMGMGPDSVMVIHGGGLYGNKETTIKRWCMRFKLLPDIVQKRLVLENCEKCFSIEDCLRISKIVNIPVVFDTHHYECYNILHPDYKLKPAWEYIPQILESWKRRDIKPKFHISEQGSGRTGHHSDYVEVVSDYLLEIPKKYGIEIDIMIEAKMKEQAIFHLYKKYPFLSCKKRVPFKFKTK